MKVAIVVPTVRRQNALLFLQAWESEFAGHTIFLVEDSPEKTFDVAATNVVHFCWRDIDNKLGKDAWIIPRKTDCIRSFGYYMAFESGADVIATLDDDCYPRSQEFLSLHLRKLAEPVKTKAWVSTGRGVPPRGMPYLNLERDSECVINHGLWQGQPDFDGITQLITGRNGGNFEPVDQVFPKGTYFPMCGMNVAFKRKIVPAMYFLLMGHGCIFDRFGDIWCGIIAKKICDHLGLSIRSGEPIVEHQRASDVWANLCKEVPGYQANEEFWKAIDSIVLTKSDICDCYKEIGDKLSLSGEYWNRVRAAMSIWANLFRSKEERHSAGAITSLVGLTSSA